jgi:hypothetical protein
MVCDENNGPARRAYRTKTPFAAVHFDQAGKGQIVFLLEGAMLRVIGPSSCLRRGFEVTYERRAYNIFEIDLVARSTLICEPISSERTGRSVCQALMDTIMAACYRCGAEIPTFEEGLPVCKACSASALTKSDPLVLG